MALKELRRERKKTQRGKDPMKVKKKSLKKFSVNIIQLPLKNTLEFFIGLA
jgi:hypothetical protein